MPHEFILEYLRTADIIVRKMFGNHAIYIGHKIYLATRKNDDNPDDDGIWISTSLKHHESLQSQFPDLINLKAMNVNKWLLLPVDATSFKETAIQLCGLINEGDERIGVEVRRRG